MRNLPTTTRYLLIANLLIFLLAYVLKGHGIDLNAIGGLHYFTADSFHFWQPITYMFLHANFSHIFFNMFAVWMFAPVIEREWGARRFAIYYLVCGLGAALVQELVWMAMLSDLSGHYGPEVVTQYAYYLNTIGASGACYGILLASGMTFPNERIMLLIPPIPMKAKYFVAGYAAIELFSAYTSNDNVAHFAHLGGMLFGWLLLRYWRKQTRQRQQFSGWQTWPNEQQRHSSWWQRLQRIFKKNETGNAHHTATRESDYEYNMRSKQEEARMDEILDKIHRSGYDSLTPDEKKELFRISRR